MIIANIELCFLISLKLPFSVDFATAAANTFFRNRQIMRLSKIAPKNTFDVLPIFVQQKLISLFYVYSKVVTEKWSGNNNRNWERIRYRMIVNKGKRYLTCHHKNPKFSA